MSYSADITGQAVKIKENNELHSSLLKTSDSSAIGFETEDNTTIYIVDRYLEHRKNNYNTFIALAIFISVLTFIYLMAKLYVSYKQNN